MSYGLYISAEGAQVQAQRLEIIANNMANVETPGFKRDIPTFQARFAEAIQSGTSYPGSGGIDDSGGGVKMIGVETDFTSTTLRNTDIPTDFAINGDGFFRVSSPQGEEFLTRAGNFTLSGEGKLITQSGDYTVLDNSGNEIVLDTSQPWSVNSGGVITQQGSEFPIGLEQVASLGDLVKVGNNMYRPLASTQPVESGQRNVQQGYLEQSGVNPTSEMMAMIETSRAFEANTKLIQHQDSMMDSLLSRVLG
ncbi:MAG: flagellar hook-basal body protein [Pirellulales bacterium]